MFVDFRLLSLSASVVHFSLDICKNIHEMNIYEIKCNAVESICVEGYWEMCTHS